LSKTSITSADLTFYFAL